jgi:glutamate carboxypeptidase
LDAYAWLESQLEEMTADLIALANQNSGSGNLEGLQRVAQWLEQWFDIPESSFRKTQLPPRCIVSDLGEELWLPTAPALRWDFHPERSRRVLLAIHYDTVFGVDNAFQACEMLSTDQLRGPGVADAKGGIVVLRNALKAMSEFELCDGCGWTVLLNPDEEIGSPSSAPMFMDIASEFDFGLLFEPALPTGELVADRKGSGNFDLVIHGKAAHAGRHFEEGRNALALLCEIFAKLHALNGLRPGLTINIGSVRGGGPANIVPELAVGRFNIRCSDLESSDWFSVQLGNLIDEANRRAGFVVKQFGSITSPPKVVTEPMRALMHAIGDSTSFVSGQNVRWKSTGGVCDGNKLAAAGLPNIDTLGPIGDQLHSSLEWVQPSSLVTKAKVIVHLMSQFSMGSLPNLVRTY